MCVFVCVLGVFSEFDFVFCWFVLMILPLRGVENTCEVVCLYIILILYRIILHNNYMYTIYFYYYTRTSAAYYIYMCIYLKIVLSGF